MKKITFILEIDGSSDSLHIVRFWGSGAVCGFQARLRIFLHGTWGGEPFQHLSTPRILMCTSAHHMIGHRPIQLAFHARIMITFIKRHLPWNQNYDTQNDAPNLDTFAAMTLYVNCLLVRNFLSQCELVITCVWFLSDSIYVVIFIVVYIVIS